MSRFFANASIPSLSLADLDMVDFQLYTWQGLSTETFGKHRKGSPNASSVTKGTVLQPNGESCVTTVLPAFNLSFPNSQAKIAMVNDPIFTAAGKLPHNTTTWNQRRELHITGMFVLHLCG